MLHRSIVSFVMIMMVGTLAQAAPTTPPSLTGELTTLGGGLDGQGGWTEGEVLFTWTVAQNPNGSWNYQYVFDSSKVRGDLSHLILETSTDLTLNDIWNSSFGFEGPKTYVKGPSNPNMPAEIYGIKFDIPSGSPEVTISFDSARAPMWGSVYAKDGAPGGSLWNTGLDGGEHWVAVPDTYTSVIPAPGSIILGSIGTGLVSWLRRRRTL